MVDLGTPIVDDGTGPANWALVAGSGTLTSSAVQGNPTPSYLSPGVGAPPFTIFARTVGHPGHYTADIFLPAGALADLFFGCTSAGNGYVARIDTRAGGSTNVWVASNWAATAQPPGTVVSTPNVWHHLDIDVTVAGQVTYTVDGVQISSGNIGGNLGAIDVWVGFGCAIAGCYFDNIVIGTTPPPPTLSSLSPTSGKAGDTVTLTGTNLAGATGVTFGGVASAFTVNSATTITATAPAHGDGAVTVVVTAPGGTSGALSFAYRTPTPPPPPYRCDTPAMLVLTMGTRTLDLMAAANGFAVSAVDLGYPTVAEDVSPMPQANGEWDDTAFFTSRVVTITGSLVPASLGSRSAVFDTLAPFLVPSARPVLTYQIDADVEPRTLTLRASALSAPATNPSVSAFQAAWKAPDPTAYAAAADSVRVLPTSGIYGRRYTTPQTAPVTSTSGWTPNRVYPAQSGATLAQATNDGPLNTWPTITVTGVCTNPVLVNDTVGAQLAIGTAAQPLTLGASDVLTVDTRNRIVYLGTDPTNSRYNYVDFTVSSWWPLLPGNNQLRFVPSSAQTSAVAVVTWHDAYL
jgi:hypothetical protein